MAEPSYDAPVRLKVPPHSIEAEQSFLGGLMLDNDAWLKAADKVAATDFYRPAHRIIFDVMAELSNANQPLDVVTLSEALTSGPLLDKAGGYAYLAELVEGTPGASNVAAYAEIVKERATLRHLIGAANEIADMAFLPEGRSSGDVLDQAEQRIFEIAEGEVKDTMPRRIHHLTDALADRLDTLTKSGKAITGVPSGFDDLDRLTAGFQDSDLVIVAARPSMGKTALIVNMAEHAVMKNHNDDASDDGGAVLIFSMEQPADQLVMRMLSSLGRIDQTRMRTGELRQHDWDRFSSAGLKSKTSRSTSTIRPRSRRTTSARGRAAWRGKPAA